MGRVFQVPSSQNSRSITRSPPSLSSQDAQAKVWKHISEAGCIGWGRGRLSFPFLGTGATGCQPG